MKDYIICALMVAILFLGSIVYKNQNTMAYQHFPIPEGLKKKSTEYIPFYLFLFFSKNDCTQCLQEIVGVLNKLSPQYCPAGLVPGKELKNEIELRRLTGASFPLYNLREYKKYLPWHTPTLFGVSPSGKIIFVLPVIPGQVAYLENLIKSIYGKLSSSFERENIPKEDDNEK